MRRWPFATLGLVTFMLMAASAGQHAAAAGPVGKWLTQDGGGVIEVSACGGALCGRIVGMREPLRADGTPQKDHAGQPRCGLTILHDARPSDPGRWAGRITDPTDGSEWHCELWIGDDGALHLRGYVLMPMLGKTQIWTPYKGTVDSACRMS